MRGWGRDGLGAGAQGRGRERVQLLAREPVGHDLGQEDVHHDSADAAQQPAGHGGAEAPGAGGQGATRDHQCESGHDDPALAEPLPDDAAGQREDGAGQHVEAEEGAELRVAEPEVGDHERRDRGDRLELEGSPSRSA
jgi:hypothetical protein